MRYPLEAEPLHPRRRARVLAAAPRKQQGEPGKILGNTLPTSKKRKRKQVRAKDHSPRVQPAISFAESRTDPEWRPTTKQQQKSSLPHAYLTTWLRSSTARGSTCSSRIFWTPS